ncbi:hypothetical protein LZ31DRAFT_560235 [Colletotrichum somersetense]|nr:hypothetical protein LZ31DRAFT_560235 [Colletotrichum somersetense]
MRWVHEACVAAKCEPARGVFILVFAGTRVWGFNLAVRSPQRSSRRCRSQNDVRSFRVQGPSLPTAVPQHVVCVWSMELWNSLF